MAEPKKPPMKRPAVTTEKRRHARTVVREATILCTTKDGPSMEISNAASHLVDVSPAGACVISPLPLRAGTLMNVEVVFPQIDTRMRCQARVKWTREVHHRGRIHNMSGLDFTTEPKYVGERRPWE